MKYLLIVVTALLFICCKKKAETSPAPQPLVTSPMVNGLPAGIKKLSGYLYAENNQDVQYSKTWTKLYSAFSEPSGNLLTSYNHYTNSFNFNTTVSGINVGQVQFNNFILTSEAIEPNFIYSYESPFCPVAATTEWSTEGNMSFKPMDMRVERGFPVISIDTTNLFQISRSGFTIDIASQISNFDSICVVINGYYSSEAIIKRYATIQPFVFTADDFLRRIPSGEKGGSLCVLTFNYSNKIIDNRMYVFELSAKWQKSVVFVP